jgi:hypothetical protein
LFVQPLSIELNAADPVAVGAVIVWVHPTDADNDALNCSTWATALLARFASTPVPAANPITAADNSATINDKMNTSMLQPQIVPFEFFRGGSVPTGWV